MLKTTDNTPYEKIGDEVHPLDIPFDIPESWEWVRHNDLFEISGGSQPPKSKFISEARDGYIRLYQIRDYGNNPVPVYIPISAASKISHKGDILLARYGASLGKVFWAEDGAYNVAMARVIPQYETELISKEFLFLFYQSSLYQSVIHANSRSAQAGFNKEDLSSLLFPLPPRSEQERIVCAYEKLQPFLNAYDDAAHSLATMNKAFPEALKKSILQEAVQGKLVPQDPSDEPAEALLEHIRAEKQRLIKEGKIKKDKHESIIFRRDNSHYEKLNGTERRIDDELPFEIPDTWIWTRLNTLGYTQTGNTPSTAHPEYRGDYIPFITPGDIADGSIDYTNQGLSDIGKKVARVCPADSILQVCIGGSIGKAALSISEVTFNQQINAITPIVVSSKYVFAVLTSFMFLSAMKESAGGTATPILNRSLWDKMYIPVPPLAEQDRIVQRIEELFPLVKGL